MIECAIGPGAEFTEVCTLERLGGDEFVIHHPDGGFRRFAFSGEGDERTVEALAGASDVEILEAMAAGHWEIALDGNLYRFPREVAATNE